MSVQFKYYDAEGKPKTLQETPIKKQICDALDQLGIQWFRLQCGKPKVKGGWMQGNKEGTPDVLASVRGVEWGSTPRFLFIETKKPGGKQSIAQLQFEADCKARGHIYLLLESVEKLLEWVKTTGARG